MVIYGEYLCGVCPICDQVILQIVRNLTLASRVLDNMLMIDDMRANILHRFVLNGKVCLISGIQVAFIGAQGVGESCTRPMISEDWVVTRILTHSRLVFLWLSHPEPCLNHEHAFLPC